MPGRPAPEVGANNDGSININYRPSEPGAHELNVTFNEQAIDGTPFRCTVDKVGGHFITAYGPGLHQGCSGKETEFSVVGADVDVSIDGPSSCEIKRKEKKGNRTDVVYLPMSPGEYIVNVKIKGKHIHGSPFSAKISGEGHKRSQYSHTATSEYILGAKNVNLSNMVANIKNPSGATEPALMKKTHDGRLALACFQPKVRGKYQVTVNSEGKPIQGSPFNLDIKDNQLCKAGNVRVSGSGKNDAEANKWNDINIDVSNAGLGSLAISIEGPHRTDIDCKPVEGNGIYEFHYRPHEPGIYLLNIKFGDDHITGSPFMINVGGKPSGRVRETVTKFIQAAEDTGPGSKCEFQLKIPGMDPLDMEAALTNPAGKTELCEIRDLPHHLYDIRFIPAESGIHTVSLKHKGLHISGSPFQYTVGPSPSGGTHKVEMGGPGLERGEVGIMNEFNVYTREAGAGQLSVAIEGLSKAKIDLVDRGHGYATVGYGVDKEGEYLVHVKYDDVHVPDSPAKVYIAPESGEAKNCTIHGLRDRGLDVGKPATFQVNLNGARGQLRGHVDTPLSTEEDLFIQEIDQDLHACRFLPTENGIYYVNVKFNEAHIPGSPFPMLIGKMGADAALVLAKGDGLDQGVSGKQCKFTVVTADAGSGTLSVMIDGPSKVAIMCTELDDGYEFAYTPMAPGDYLITIKYCNVTIAGCPTKAVIGGTGRPSEITEHSGLVVETVEKKAGESKKGKSFKGDATKVVARGNGLVKAFSGSNSSFNIDIKDAGQGALFLGMVSQSGNPVAELSYKRARGTLYNCSYKVLEKGECNLTIRWGGDDIPGSPFKVKIN